jgi:PHD/YefM family antitoxin component YafN of YafNO toxin-antitoxin module
MINPDDVHSLTDFQRNAKKYVRRLRRSRRPEVLTVNGKAALVILDAATYQRTMTAAAKAAEVQAVDEALAQMETGPFLPLERVDRELRAEFARRRKSRRKSA